MVPTMYIKMGRMKAKNAIAVTFLSAAIGLGGAVCAPGCFASPQAAAQTVAKRIGTIKAINGSAITLAPESGSELAVTVAPNARLMRLAPGEKDLKNTTPAQLQELQVGDTIRVRGYASDDGKSLNALEVIVISRSALSAVSDQIRQDWQKRGMGGLVHAIDPAAGTVTISVSGFAGSKSVAIHSSKSTIIRRYAPDSVKFEDAKPSTLQEIHVGDQLRARGDRNTDGTELAADEIVSGTFPILEGTVKSVDPSAGTLSIQDVLSKKTVQVKVTSDSQLHKIPAEMAQRFAMRLKGGMPPGVPGAATNSSANSSGTAAWNGQRAQGNWTPGATGGGAGAAGGMGGMRSGGAPDFQQILSHLPASTLADLNLQKGDALVILATEGSASNASTVITLLSGVEPILQAAPSASQIMMLTPWNLGGAPGGDAGSQ